MMKIIRPLYNWTMDKAEHKNALWFLAFISFIESSIFPIPPDILLIPMILARPNKAWLYATVCTISSVIGGIAGYAIGYFLYDIIGQPVLDLYGYGDKFSSFQTRYNEWGAWIVLMAGVTPFPYKIITIASGVTQLNFAVFCLSSIVARGLRFFIIAGLLWKFGAPIRQFIDKYLGPLTVLGFILLIGGFVVAKYML